MTRGEQNEIYQLSELLFLELFKINKIYLDKQPLDEIGPGDFAKTL